jgi:aryl-alcohol dehydrogenase-like predicted oxidoreductase
LEGGVKERVQLSTEFGFSFASGKREIRRDPAYVRAAGEASLKRLQLDCIDLYYQHCVDTRLPIEVTVYVNEMATRKGCTPSQLAWAWVHHQAKGMTCVPFQEHNKVENFDENIGALSVELTPEEMAELESFASQYICC